MATNNIMYDTVTQRFIWDDGSNWIDSSGTIVTPPTLDLTGDISGTGSPIGSIAVVVKSDPNTIVVCTDAPNSGQFNSIAAAVASITDATATNIYTIEVSAGWYVEPTIVMKPYVFIIGSNRRAVYIMPLDPTQSIFVGSPSTTLKELTLCGATNPANAALVYTGGPITAFAGNEFKAYGLNFIANATPIAINGSDSLPLVSAIFEEVTIIANAVMVTAITIMGAPTLPTGVLVTLRGLKIIDDGISPLTNWQFAIIASGVGVVVLVNDFFMTITGAYPTTAHGVHIQNGANMRLIAGIVSAFGTNIHCANVGAAPNLDVLAVTTEVYPGTTTFLLMVEHPGTTGSFSGSIDQTLCMIADGAPFSISSSDPLGGMVNTGPMYVGRDYNGIVDVEPIIRLGSPLGLYFGGALLDGGGLTLNVAAGSGYFVDPTVVNGDLVEFAWSAQSIVVPAYSVFDVYFNNTGILTLGSGLPDFTASIYLGKVVTAGAFIGDIIQTPSSAMHYSNKQDRFNRLVLGCIFVSGSAVSEDATTPYTLDVGTGHFFYSVNEFFPTGGNSVVLVQFWNVNAVPASYTQASVIPVKYDNAGTLTTPTSSYYVKHALYLSAHNTSLNSGGADTYFLVIGQAQYASLPAAEAALTTLAPATLINETYAHIADIIVQQGASHIAQIIDTRPFMSYQAAGVASTAVHGNLLGLDADDHHQYLLVSGARALSASLNLGTNAIINAASYNGMDPTAHAARHAPNGADPIATGAAIGLTPSTTNAAGIQNALARSDHTHAITGFAAVATSGSYTDLSNTPVLATVATSGRYTDLSSLPTIPFQTSQLTNNSGFLTANQSIALTGDASGTGTTSVALTLATSGVTAGTYNSVTVDAKGRVTAGTNISSSGGTIILTGDVTGSGTSSVATTLAASGVTAGNYNNVSVDAKGRVISGSYINYGSGVTLYFTGDVTGNSATNTINLTLNNSIGSGTYTQVAVNNRGLVTSGSTPTIFYTGDATGSASLGSNVALTLANVATAGSGFNTFTLNSKGQVTTASTVAYLTSNQTVTLSGDATGSGTTNLPLTLAAIGTAGTYCKVITDSKGRVTSGSNPTINYTGDATGSALLGSNVVLTLANIIGGGSGYNTVTVNAKGQVTSASTTPYLTTNQTISVSGDVTGSGSTNLSLTLSSAGTAGTYTQCQTDTKGRVTFGQNPTINMFGDLSGSFTLGSNITATLPTVNSNVGTFNNVTVNAKGLVTGASNAGTTPAVDVQIFSTPGAFNWTMAAGAAKSVSITCIGAGASGGSGRKGAAATARWGGGGGGGGGYSHVTIPASALGLGATVAGNVGTGGAPVAGISAADTDGLNGNSGTGSWFGGTTVITSIVIANGGNAGNKGTALAGNGGGFGSGMYNGTNGGGSSITTAGGAGSAPANTSGASGGGGGGGISATDTVYGGGTGTIMIPYLSSVAAPIGGTFGVSGNPGNSLGAGFYQPGAGASGGGASNSNGVNGGTGGAGGLYGAGGAGGGAGTDGLNNSGGGGAGANGCVMITTYF